MIPQYELRAEDIRRYTIEKMKEYFAVAAHRYCCTTEMIFDVIVKASAKCRSVKTSCDDLEQVADSTTIREYLNQAIEVKKLRQQERQVNTALASCISVSIQRQEIELAVDLHDETFYGKKEGTRRVTEHGQAKKGTKNSIRIATAYVIWLQVRMTMDVRYILPGETALESLQFLLERLKKLGFSSKVLYMDKGFASTPVLKYLTAQGQGMIITCQFRGKKAVIRDLCHGAASYIATHVFSDSTQATLALKASLIPDKTGTRRRKWLAFIVIILAWTVETIYQKYHLRFWIECSYRILRRVRAATASRNPALRFFLLGVGLLWSMPRSSSLGVRTPHVP